MAAMIPLSRAPIARVACRMSRGAAPKQKMRRAPGAAVWMAVAMPRNSASPCATLPANVTGEVAPAMDIE